MEDSKIIELYWARSEDAISETDKKYGKYCHYIAFNILNSEQDAEECVNDTFLRAWNAIPPRRPTHLKTFLGKITRNLSLNLYEKKSADKRGGNKLPQLFDELSECIPSGCSEFTDDFALTEIINKFLSELSTQRRKIFVRRYWYASSIKEIAADFGVSESKVTVSLFRTREKLRAVLKKEGITI